MNCTEAAQDRETPVEEVAFVGGRLRYTYARSGDAQLTGAKGQDFLSYCYEERDQNHTKIVFALCDGVGSSFMGDLGARFIGNALCTLLWSHIATRPSSIHEDRFRHEFHRRIMNQTPQSDQEIDEYELPADLPPLLQRALEEQRAYGSEAMFVCGRRLKDSLVVAWLGDARIQVLAEDYHPVAGFVQQPITDHRWSSKEGARGQIGVRIFKGAELRQVKHVVAFTDGIAAYSEQLAQMDDAALNAAIRATGDMPASDDIAVLHITFDD